MTRLVVFLLVIILYSACGSTDSIQNVSENKPAEDKRVIELHSDIKKIEPFFNRMGKPKPYDWLRTHNEPGQTFDEYINSSPTLPTKERRTIYVLPLGNIDENENRIVQLTADYLEAFYGLPVKKMPQQPLTQPTKAGDYRKTATGEQTKTGYILDSILKPKLPKDAAALIALTNVDLFEDPTTNYVFGQASLDDRVGVWSLKRLKQNADRTTILLRTFKIASHETGHMFSMKHCTKYECVMSGTNYLGETDSRPIDACPECMAKIAWLSGVSPKDRYNHLAEFCKKNGLTKEADEFTRKAVALK